MSNKMLRILMVILLFLILLITVWVVRAGYADYFYTYTDSRGESLISIAGKTTYENSRVYYRTWMSYVTGPYDPSDPYNQPPDMERLVSRGRIWHNSGGTCYVWRSFNFSVPNVKDTDPFATKYDWLPIPPSGPWYGIGKHKLKDSHALNRAEPPQPPNAFWTENQQNQSPSTKARYKGTTAWLTLGCGNVVTMPNEAD